MRTPIGIFRDGQLFNADGLAISEAPKPSRDVTVVAPVERVERVEHEPPRRNIKPLDPLDEFNNHLAAAIRIAQSLSEDDQQRASEFTEAFRATLTATTRLKSTELRRWQAALRNAK